jgi:RimJ/RimL family protein N-acetyltransferase
MTLPSDPDPAALLVEAVSAAASSTLGRELPAGTTVVGSPDREGSKFAVAYPLGDRTIVWCAPARRAALETLNGPVALGNDEFVVRATELGGVFDGRGHQRVLARPAPDPAVEPSRLVVLDRDDADDRRLIAAFVDRCSADDLDDAELAMDELDEAIVGVLDASGALASYASARPWRFDARFDDVAVITRPDQRGRGLGTAAVAALSRRRQRVGRMMFYNCDVDNLGSNGVAEAAGFELVYTVTAVSFG